MDGCSSTMSVDHTLVSSPIRNMDTPNLAAAEAGRFNEETKSQMKLGNNNNNNNQLICCKVYISESQNTSILDSIELASRRTNPRAVIVNKFMDRAYNRVNYTLVSYVTHDAVGTPIYSPIQQTLIDMAEAAYESINLELHSGTHPRLGVVDDIIFHPLADASLEEAAWAARTFAKDMGNILQIPIYLYEAAHPTGKPASTIRRELGYFRPTNQNHQWSGFTTPNTLSISPPDSGPSLSTPSRGICMIGAGHGVRHYNIPVLSTDITVVRHIARLVSARGGGLPTVQTIGLVHGEESTEIACRLLEPDRVGADKVQGRVEMLANEAGIGVENGYFTDLSPEMIVDRYWSLVNGNS